MKKVFITESTFKRIIYNIEISDYMETYLPSYERLRSILARPEKQQLLRYLKILEDFDNINKYNKITKEYKSNPKKRLIFYKEKAPAFHLKKDCRYLNSNYQNYNIPIEIKDNDIEKYRSFFLKNKDLYNRNYEAFLGHVEIKFKVKIHNVKEMRYENSGINKTDNYILEPTDIILTRIDAIIKKMNRYRLSDKEKEKLISKVGFATHKAKYVDNNGNYSLYIDDKNSPIFHWHNYKARLKQLIEKYFISTSNPEFKFDKKILEQCGLIPCHFCMQKDSFDNRDNHEEIIIF